MSNKPTDKSSKKTSENTTATDVLNQVYRPSDTITVNGSFLNTLMGGIMNVRASRLSNVFDVNGKQIGFSVNANDQDIESLAQFMLQAHTANISKGLTVSTETLKAELETLQQRKEEVVEA